MSKVLDITWTATKYVGATILAAILGALYYASVFYLLGRTIDCLFIAKSLGATFFDVLSVGYLLWFFSPSQKK